MVPFSFHHQNRPVVGCLAAVAALRESSAHVARRWPVSRPFCSRPNQSPARCGQSRAVQKSLYPLKTEDEARAAGVLAEPRGNDHVRIGRAGNGSNIASGQSDVVKRPFLTPAGDGLDEAFILSRYFSFMHQFGKVCHCRTEPAHGPTKEGTDAQIG